MKKGGQSDFRPSPSTTDHILSFRRASERQADGHRVHPATRTTSGGSVARVMGADPAGRSVLAVQPRGASEATVC